MGTANLDRFAKTRSSRKRANRVLGRINLEELENRELLSGDGFGPAAPQYDRVPGEPGNDGKFSFYLARFDGLSGTPQEQANAGRTLLHNAGISDVKVRASGGSQGLLLVETTREVTPGSMNQLLSKVPGYTYLRRAEGVSETGELTRVYKGGVRFNPLYSQISTRFSSGPLGPTGSGSSSSPTLLGSFSGLTSNDNPFTVSPPDTIVAAGPNHVIEAVNISLGIYDKAGTPLLSQSLAQFFAPLAPVDPFDPLVTYDDNANRWIIGASSFNNFGGADFLFAVSNDSNPLNGFTEMQKIGFGSNFFDFPKIGFNADSILFTGNLFNDPNVPLQIIAVDKSSVLDANPATVTTYLTQRSNFRAMAPATMHGANPGSDVMYFVEENGYGNGSALRVVKMTNVLTPLPIYTEYVIDVNDYGFPPLAQQPGGYVNTNDTTIINADWRNGKMVAAHTVGDVSDSEAHVAWYLFDAPDLASASPSLIQEGRLDPGDGVSTYFPSIAINASGGIGMTYMQSSPSQYASMVVTGRTASDPTGTMRDGTIVALGEDYLDGFGRAGDYSGITVDPSDGTSFWAANEYKAAGVFWSTAIAHFSLGMSVAGTTPAGGAIVATIPSAYRVDFSDPFDPSLINAQGVTVNGVAASGFTIIDADTISFTFSTSPVTTQGLQTIAIAAGTVVRLEDGDPVQDFSSTFRYDMIPLQVVSTSPTNGSVVQTPLTSLTINLNEAYDPASVSTSDLHVSMGSVVGFNLIDADSIEFLLAGLTTEAVWTFSISAGALTDVYGNPGQAYSGSLNLDFGTVAFPLPMSPILPLGSLAYQTSINGSIGFSGDTDSFTLSVDPGQSISVVVKPLVGTFRPRVELYRANGGSSVLVSSTSATGMGKDAVIQTFKVPSHIYVNGPSTTYKVTVLGVGTSVGAYSVQILLNAAVEPESNSGATNNTRATATSLETSFITLDPANPVAERGAIIGRLTGGPQLGDVYVGVRSPNFFGGSIQRFDATGTLVQTITSPVLDAGVISDVEFGPNNVLYVGLTTNFFGSVVKGEIARFDLQGKYLGSIALPDDVNNGYLYPFGFDVAPDGSVWVAQLNTGNVVHVFPSGKTPQIFPVGSLPIDVAVRTDGQVLVSLDGQVYKLDPSTGNVSFYAFDPNYSPQMLNLTSTGSLWLGDFYGPTAYDANGVQTQFIDNYGTIDPQNDTSGNLWVSNYYYGGIQRFSPSGTSQIFTVTPGGAPLGLAVLGTDFKASVPDSDFVDYYSFTLDAGRAATIKLTLLGGQSTSVEVQDANGTTVALGIGGLIDQFVSQASGTYYVKVAGTVSQYSLLVTRNADFGAGSTFDTASETLGTQTSSSTTSGRRVILGYVAAGGENFDDGNLSEYQVAPSPFGQSTSMSAVASAAHDGPFGLQILDGDGWIYRDDSTTHLKQGDSFSFWVRANGVIGGRAYIGFGATAAGTLSVIIAPNSGEFSLQRNAGYGFETLAAVGQSWLGGSWYKVAVDWGTDGTIVATLFASDGTTQLNTVTAIDNTITQGGIAFRGFGSVWNVDTYGTGASSNFTRINAAAGQTLDVTVKLPGVGSGEFVNTLDPALRLYDPAGNVVLTTDPATREAGFVYTIPTGMGGVYRIEILPSPSTPQPTKGEYLLVVRPVTTALPAFNVLGTNPAFSGPAYLPPGSVTVDFNDGFKVTTVQGSDLKIDGVGGSGVGLVDGDTARFATSFVYSFGGHYYTVTSSPKTWADAEAEAVARGGHLVTINSFAEQKFLKQTFFSAANRESLYWAGLNDIAEEGTFVWSSGEPVDFTYWAPFEPNDYYPGEDGVVLNYFPQYVNGEWNDFPTSALVMGIIELTSLPSGSWVATEGAHTLSIAAGSITDLQNTPISAYSKTFTLDYTAPRIISTSIAEGSILPTGDLTYTVTFSEPLNPAFVDASDFVLSGLTTGFFAPSSVSLSPSGTTLTVTYQALPDDSFTLVLLSNPSSFVDAVGLMLDGEPAPGTGVPSGDGIEGGDFVFHFVTDTPTLALPTPLIPVAPLGSLVYQSPSPIEGGISFSGDTDDFTISLDPGQKLTVIVSSLTFDILPVVTLYDPSNTAIGSASASEDGGMAVLELVGISTGGLYRINIGSATGLGRYRISLRLNAAVETESLGGPANNTIATAQPLDAAMLDLGNGMTRAAVLGTSDGPGGFVASAVPYNFTDISGSGFATLEGTDDSVYDLDLSTYGFSFPFFGQTYTSLYYSTNGLITFGSSNGSYSNDDLSFSPYQAAIAVLWNDLEAFSNNGVVYWEVLGSGDDQKLVVQWNVGYYAYTGKTISFQAILGEDGSIELNYADLFDPNTSASEGAFATVGVKGEGFQGPDRLLLSYYSGPNEFVGTGKSTLLMPSPGASDYYAVDLVAGQTLTAVLADLVGTGVHVRLLDGDGNILVDSGSSTAEGLADLIANFVVPADGTYYLAVFGDVVHNYNLVVTVGAAFDSESNDTQSQAQPIAGNQGALGAVVNQSGLTVGTVIEGLNGSESGFYLPPDTIIAVGPNAIIQGTNVAIRFTDKAGNILLTQSLDSFFAPLGVPSAGDPYVVYDDNSGRFYVLSIDGLSNNNLLFAVSNTSDPMDGFSEMHRVPIAPVGDFADFPKMGFNADAVVLTVNSFGSLGAASILTTIDKSTLLDADSSTLAFYNSQPEFNFRAMVPAQMHGASVGSPMYFVKERAYVDGQAIQIVTMTDYFSTSPTFVTTTLLVAPYLFPPSAQQPGGSAAANDTTFTQLDWRNGTMTTAHTVGIAEDTSAPKVRWYQIDTTGAEPVLLQQGTVNPGPGIGTYFGSIAQDASGNLGMTYMQSSSSEFISMYVAGKLAGTTPGVMGVGTKVGEGLGYNYYSEFRNGDYSAVVLDPTDGSTFWAGNEYSGLDFLWNTKIASFQVAPDLDNDWYNVDVADGESLTITIAVPASGPGEFVNTLVPRIELFDASGNLIASAEGQDATLTTDALAEGTYSVKISSVGLGGGEYVLSISRSMVGSFGRMFGLGFGFGSEGGSDHNAGGGSGDDFGGGTRVSILSGPATTPVLPAIVIPGQEDPSPATLPASPTQTTSNPNLVDQALKAYEVPAPGQNAPVSTSPAAPKTETKARTDLVDLALSAFTPVFNAFSPDEGEATQTSTTPATKVRLARGTRKPHAFKGRRNHLRTARRSS